MFIGHLPAGYCLTTTLLKCFGCKDDSVYRRYLWIGLIASVLPDVDMIYFYWIDHRQHVHHAYWTFIFEIMIVLMAGYMLYYRNFMEHHKTNIKGSVRTCG